MSDGLPVVPPTRERVEAAIAAAGRPRDDMIALVAPALGRATVERIAVNAVMAGCRPEYLPVVIAGVEAMCDEGVSLVGVSGTTDAVAPIFSVNGPARSEEASPWPPLHVEHGFAPADRRPALSVGAAGSAARGPRAEVPRAGAPEACRRRRHRRAVHRADPGLALRRLTGPAGVEEDRAVSGLGRGARADNPSP